MEVNDEIRALKNAWNELVNLIHYENKASRRDNKEGDLSKLYFVCWQEADISFQLGRLFYRGLTEKDVHFHVEVNLKSSNFNDYDFAKQNGLQGVKKALGRIPRVDFLISNDFSDRIDIIGEAKYFRYSVDRWRRTPKEDIKEDWDKLKAFRDNEVCEKVIYVVLDKYYHYQKEQKNLKEIKAELKKMKRDGIITLFEEV